MPITVTMIEDKEFKIKVRGYDQVEVDEFLDAICDEMISMQNTIQSLREQLKQQQNLPSFAPVPPVPMAPSAPPAPLSTPREEPAIPHDLETAHKLLEKTQRACDEALANARTRAQDIVKQAEEAVPDPKIAAMQEEETRLRSEIDALKQEAAAFQKRFQALLHDQQDISGTEKELF